MNLVPCPSCTRHVKTIESTCPFCKSALPDSLSDAVIPGATQRLSRAAAFAFTASIAVSGCSAGNVVVPTDSGAQKDGNVADDGGGQAAYGAPAPLYGAVPVDSGPHPDDDGGAQAAYGAPFPDASSD